MKTKCWMGYLFVVLGFAGFVCTGVRSADAQLCPLMVGRVAWDDWALSIDVGDSRNHVYIGTGRSVVVVDVSDPFQLEVAAELEFPDEGLGDIQASGDFVYWVGCSGLRIIDVHDPLSPVEVGFWDGPYCEFNLAVSGGFAYVADGGGLRVIDVSDPRLPIEAGYWGIIEHAFDVAVSGGYAYVSGSFGDGPSFSNLKVIDVSDPQTPIEVGSCRLGDDENMGVAIEVYEGHAYVATGGRWSVVDVSDASAPLEVQHHDLQSEFSRATGFVFSGRRLFLPVCFFHKFGRQPESCLNVYDVSDPSSAIMVAGDVERDACFYDAVENEQTILVAAGSGGLYIFEVSRCRLPIPPDPRSGTGRQKP